MLEINLKNNKASILTIGNFDGVHLGHQKLFRQMLELSRNNKMQAIVIIFDPHPLLYFGNNIKLLTSQEEKIKKIKRCGIENTIVLPFDTIVNLTASEFLKKITAALDIKKIVIGQNYKFGHNRTGDVEFLKNNTSKYDYSLEIIKPLIVDGDIVSSSRIRELIKKNNTELAAKLLS